MQHKILPGTGVGRDPSGGGRTRPSDALRFFTIAEVAERLGVSERTVRRWIRRGDLVAHRIGAVVRVAERDLDAFLARHRHS